ncbi:hypothetical protein C0J52_16106 [Blattella germanica]|nr:hypothetical protein C0J52_16106 [Blattella germanica]PSN41176.1 hypothetical protein C0J52_16106 [Blattella germanica]
MNAIRLSSALQQPRGPLDAILRPVRQATAGEKTYDQCSHPFHSFLCNPAPRPRTLIPEGSASFNVKQVVKPSPPIIAAPSFDVKTIVSPTSNIAQKIKPFPPEGSIDEPSAVNCQQHNTFVKAPITVPTTTTTPKPIIIVGASSFARESKLPPQPYLPPVESLSPAQTFLEPQRLDPPFIPTTPKNKPILEGQAANTAILTIPKNNEVDNCKHAFHSFLCSSRKSVPSTTPKFAPDLSLRGESSFVRTEKVQPPQPKRFPQSIFVQSTKPTVPITTTTTRRPITTTSRQIPVSTPSPPILAEAAQTPLQVVVPQIQKQPNICNDPFHSFLCQPVNTQKRKQKYGEINPSSTISKPPSSLRGDSSFIQESIVFNQPHTTVKPGTPKPKPTTSFRNNFVPQTASAVHQPFYFCNHTLPTVLPTTKFVTTARTLNIVSSKTTKKPFSYSPITQRPIQIDADSSFNQPSRIPFPSTTVRTTTIRIPDPPVRFIPAAQTPDVTIVRPDNTHNHDHDHDHGHNHDHHIDICKDPFHSFLCTPVEPSKRKRPTGELPAKFKNPVPSNLAGASSFNAPTKVFPDRNTIRNLASGSSSFPITARTTPKPITSTTTLRPTTRTSFTPRKFEIQPQPDQIHQTRLFPKPETPIKKDEPCQHSSNLFQYHQDTLSTTEAPYKAENTFLSPSKVLPVFPLIALGTDNNGYKYPKPDQPLSTTTPHPGYEYNKPKNELRYPASSFSRENNNNQPPKTFPPNNFDSQSTNNQPGYNYDKPLNPLSISTTRKPPQNIFGQSSGSNDNSQGYTYPKPPVKQQFPSSTPGNNVVSSTTPKGYNYPSPINIPSSNTFIGAGSQVSINLTPLLKNQESAQSPPPCEHQSHQVSRSISSSLSPAEFVRGPRAAVSVSAASKDIPDKCNHPFLGYICKKSS